MEGQNQCRQAVVYSGMYCFGYVNDKSAWNCILLCKAEDLHNSCKLRVVQSKAAWAMYICPLYHKPDILSFNNPSEATSVSNKKFFSQREIKDFKS